MGYAARNNPTTEAARRGELPPKPEPMSKREKERLLMQKIREVTGIPALEAALERRKTWK